VEGEHIMITQNDQTSLFSLIAKALQRNLDCYAFGGTAMMFYGYKDETKDIDLYFADEGARGEFVRAIGKLGFSQRTTDLRIYVPEKLKDRHPPMMLVRDDSRFDLFAVKIFKTILSPKMKEDFYALHEFKGQHTLRVYVVRKEHIFMLKAVTERQNDFDDIKLIVQQEKQFDWQYLVDEAVWQYTHGDSWVLLDVERTLRELQKYVFIEEKYVRQLNAVNHKLL
jgi:hypothetical protein